jgi:cytochrome c biogenesis protein CcmG, thiol:disulfide interchange protein DsbE
MSNSARRHLALTFLLCMTAVACDPAFATSFKPWKQGATPPIALKDLQGQPRSLDEFLGKVVIVNFWATWCEPCIEEMPSLQKLKDRLADEKFVVVGVNLGEGEARIKSFMDKTGATFPILLDRDGVVRKGWKVNGVPATFVLDATGRIRFAYTGVLDFSDEVLNAQILGLLPRKTAREKS